MKQEITLISPTRAKVTASIMPLDSKHWNDGLEEDDRFKQIELTLTFDMTGVLEGTELPKVTPMAARALDGYFIDAREALKKEAFVGNENKSNQEKYNAMVALVATWEKLVIELPIRKGRTPGQATVWKRAATSLKTQKTEIMDMFKRYPDVPEKTRFGLLQQALEIPAENWLAEKGKIEAAYINAKTKR